MPTKEDVLAYLGIDYADEVVEKNVTKAMNAAWQTLLGSVGEDVETYLPNDPRVEQLVKDYTDDLYSERGVSAKVSNATRMMVSTMELQLRLELARAREKVVGGES